MIAVNIYANNRNTYVLTKFAFLSITHCKIKTKRPQESNKYINFLSFPTEDSCTPGMMSHTPGWEPLYLHYSIIHSFVKS